MSNKIEFKWGSKPHYSDIQKAAEAAKDLPDVPKEHGFLEFIINGVKYVAVYCVQHPNIFIIVCMVGMICVIVGKDDWGKKICGGGFLGYIVAKVVASLC